MRTSQLNNNDLKFNLCYFCCLELSCERECSRGEDYRLIKLSIIDYAVRSDASLSIPCDCRYSLLRGISLMFFPHGTHNRAGKKK